MKEIELEDATKILDIEWLIDKTEFFISTKEPASIRLSQIANWYYFDEQNLEIKELIFNSVKVYNYSQLPSDYMFILNDKSMNIGFPTFAPTITELKKKLLLDVRDRIDQINIERTELLERMEQICEL